MNKWTRRGFITAGIISSSALIVGVSVRPGNRVSKLKGLVSDGSDTLVNAWVKINPDNRVTIIVPHCEMGQGVHTSLPMMLAEEMDVDWKLVDVMEAPADLEYANYALARGFILGDKKIPESLVPTVNGSFMKITQMIKLQITGGSTAIRTTGVHAMRMAGASAREMLVEAAAQKWNVPTAEIKTKNSFLIHEATENKSAYAEFAKAASEKVPPSAPQLKSNEQYTIVGTSPGRLDIPAKVDGSAMFGIDTVIPDMVYATVKSSPVFGTRLQSVDSAKARAMKGVLNIIQLDNAVAVIATGYWPALQALNALKINWTETPNNQRSTASIFSQFKQDMMDASKNGDEQTDVKKGDVDSAYSASSTIVEAQYSQPYLAHAPMEPLNCTVKIENGKCDVWTGNQNPLGFRSEVADALDFDIENVTVHNSYLGGGFGRRALADYATQAALIAAQLTKPVKVIWSREEDIRQDRYRQAGVSTFKAGLDGQGKPTFWTNQYVDKHEPEEAPHIPYDIEHQYIHYVDSPTHVPFGPWRSVDHSLHAFFTESFIDELAHKSQNDPYLFRRDLLKHTPRFQHVLDTAIKASDWDEPTVAGHGRGVAIHQSFNTIVAQVAEVEVHKEKIRVTKVICAVDPGYAINPDGLIAQMESGIIFGLTAALYGEITIQDGQVTQSNFHDYPMLRIDETPEIEVHIIHSGESLGGAGEPGTPPIMAAVANAVFNATGKRIRSLPLNGKLS